MNWLANILRSIADAIDTPKPPVSFAEYLLNSAVISGLICPITKDHVYIWDTSYWAYTLEDWKAVIKDVLNGLPKYLVDKFDCEDFAKLCASRVLERYQVNTMGIAVGNSPLGYHGFNVFIAKEGGTFRWHILEPQTGEIDPVGYELETVII